MVGLIGCCLIWGGQGGPHFCSCRYIYLTPVFLTSAHFLYMDGTIIMSSALVFRRLAQGNRPVITSMSRRAMSTPVPESAMSGEDKSLNRLSRTESIVSSYIILLFFFRCYNS